MASQLNNFDIHPDGMHLRAWMHEYRLCKAFTFVITGC